MIPEEWPWEEAKKFFEHPDVTPAKDVEVRSAIHPFHLAPSYLHSGRVEEPGRRGARAILGH